MADCFSACHNEEACSPAEEQKGESLLGPLSASLSFQKWDPALSSIQLPSRPRTEWLWPQVKEGRLSRWSWCVPWAAHGAHSTFSSVQTLPAPRRTCNLVKKYYALFYSVVYINHGQIPGTVSTSGEGRQQIRIHSGRLLAIGFLPHIGKKCKWIQ